MNVDLNLSSMYSLIRGTTSEIQKLECTLRCWAAQYDRNGEGRDVSLRDGDCLFVLTGAMIALIERGDFRKENFFTEPYPVNLKYQAGCLREAELLRSYQAAACVAALGAHWRRGIIEAPTGAGKTRIAAGIIALGILHGVSHWVYLVQNRNLSLQSSKSFEELVPQMLLCLYKAEPGHGPTPNYKVGCGSYGTVQPDILASAGGLIVDEVHFSVSRTRLQAMAPCRAHIRIGMSATPLLRQDAGNALVAGVFGPVVYKIGMEVLQKAGHLAKGKVTTLEVNHG